MDDMKVRSISSQLAINMATAGWDRYKIDPATVVMIIEIIMEIIEFIQNNYKGRSGRIFLRPDTKSKIKMISLFRKVRLTPLEKVEAIRLVWDTIRDLRKRKVI